jgi:hypothetical protein
MQTGTHKLVEADGDRLAAAVGRQSDDVAHHRSRLRPCSVSRTVSWPGTASVDDVYDVIVSGRATGEDGWVRWLLGESDRVNVVRQRRGEQAYGVVRPSSFPVTLAGNWYVRTLYFTALPEEATAIFRRLEQLDRRQVARHVAEAGRLRLEQAGRRNVKAGVKEAMQHHALLETPEYTPAPVTGAVGTDYAEPKVEIYDYGTWQPGGGVTLVTVKARSLHGAVPSITRSKRFKSTVPHASAAVKAAVLELTAKVQQDIAARSVKRLDRTPTIVAPWSYIDKVRPFVEPFDYVRCVSGNSNSDENANSEAVAGLMRRQQPGQQTYRVLTSHGQPGDYMDRSCLYFNATPDEAEAVRLRLERVGRQRIRTSVKESMHPKLLKKRFDPRGEPKVLPDIDDDPDTEIGVPSPDTEPEPDDEPGPWRRTIEPGEEPGPKACDVVDKLIR